MLLKDFTPHYPIKITSINGSSKFMSFYSHADKQNMEIVAVRVVNGIIHIQLASQKGNKQ